MIAIVVLGCERESSIRPATPPCPIADARTRATALTTSITRGEIDRCAVVDGPAIDLEVREALVETDERRRETFTGHAALSARLRSLATGTIASTGPLRCYGDCCDVEHRGMHPGTLYLRRMCFAYATRVSSIVFVEVR